MNEAEALDLIRFIEDGDGSEEKTLAATETLLRRCEEVAPDSPKVRVFLFNVYALLDANGYERNGTTLRAGTS